MTEAWKKTRTDQSVLLLFSWRRMEMHYCNQCTCRSHSSSICSSTPGSLLTITIVLEGIPCVPSWGSQTLREKRAERNSYQPVASKDTLYCLEYSLWTVCLQKGRPQPGFKFSKHIASGLCPNRERKKNPPQTTPHGGDPYSVPGHYTPR